VPRIGHVPLRRVREHHTDSLYADLLADGRADGRGGLVPKTVLGVHVILHKAPADASRRGLTVHNVVRDRRSSEAATAEGRDPRVERQPVAGFLEEAKGERLFPAFSLAANIAMRRSEILGLPWSDV